MENEPLCSANDDGMMQSALAKYNLVTASFGEKGLLIIFGDGYMDIRDMHQCDGRIRGTKKAQQILSPSDENGGKGGFITGRTSMAPAIHEANGWEWLIL